MNLQDIKNIKKIENNIKIVKIAEGKLIKIIKYLPAKEKMLFVYDILGRCFGDDGRLIPISVELSTRINFVIFYSDLEIDLEKNDIFEVYDLLEQSGILEQILTAIPDEEMEAMLEYIDDAVRLEIERNNSIAGGIKAMGESIAKLAVPEFKEMLKEDPSILN